MFEQNSYGIKRRVWQEMKKDVIDTQISSKQLKEKFKLDNTQVWFLFDTLLQGKYNHLYTRPPLKEIEVGKYVHCEEFGRGEIKAIFSNDLMAVKFDSRDFATMCDSIKMVTIYDTTKRKITEL